MGRTPDLGAKLEEKSGTIRSQQAELMKLRREVNAANQALDEARSNEETSRRLVRWMLRDQNVPDLTLSIAAGSPYDLAMATMLCQVMSEEDRPIPATARYVVDDDLACAASPDPDLFDAPPPGGDLFEGAGRGGGGR